MLYWQQSESTEHFSPEGVQVCLDTDSESIEGSLLGVVVGAIEGVFVGLPVGAGCLEGD
jgi:hypothetical protein